jgi:hypothetical protein
VSEERDIKKAIGTPLIHRIIGLQKPKKIINPLQVQILKKLETDPLHMFLMEG